MKDVVPIPPASIGVPPRPEKGNPARIARSRARLRQNRPAGKSEIAAKRSVRLLKSDENGRLTAPERLEDFFRERREEMAAEIQALRRKDSPRLFERRDGKSGSTCVKTTFDSAVNDPSVQPLEPARRGNLLRPSRQARAKEDDRKDKFPRPRHKDHPIEPDMRLGAQISGGENVSYLLLVNSFGTHRLLKSESRKLHTIRRTPATSRPTEYDSSLQRGAIDRHTSTSSDFSLSNRAHYCPSDRIQWMNGFRSARVTSTDDESFFLINDISSPRGDIATQ